MCHYAQLFFLKEKEMLVVAGHGSTYISIIPYLGSGGRDQGLKAHPWLEASLGYLRYSLKTKLLQVYMGFIQAY